MKSDSLFVQNILNFVQISRCFVQNNRETPAEKLHNTSTFFLHLPHILSQTVTANAIRTQHQKPEPNYLPVVFARYFACDD